MIGAPAFRLPLTSLARPEIASGRGRRGAEISRRLD